MNVQECQIHSLGRIHEPLGLTWKMWRRRRRLKRIFRRRWRYIINVLGEILEPGRRTMRKKMRNMLISTLQPGDMVRVRSKEEIQATLDSWNNLNGCGFMEEMWPYCNTTQRVLKRVERFLDERDYLIKNTKGIVILEGLFCEGTKDFGVCDRTCFYFWREEWLAKLDEG